MGVVYEALESATQRRVALKTILLEDGRSGDRARARMQREADALSRLEHPGLVPCFGAGEGPQGFTIVMGLVEGDSAGDRLRTHGPFPLPRALQIMGDVPAEVLDQLLKVDNEAWRGEIPLIEDHFTSIGERLPGEMADELRELEKRLAN